MLTLFVSFQIKNMQIQKEIMCKVRVRAGGVIGTSATMGSAPANHAWHAPLSLSSTALASICEMTSILYALAWDAACAKSKCYTCLCLKPHLLTGLSDCPVYCRLQVLLQDDRPEELMPTICTFAQYKLKYKTYQTGSC